MTARTFSAYSGVLEQTLANWRYRDRRSGRTEAGPGFPVYRYFGGAVRYWLDAEVSGGGRVA